MVYVATWTTSPINYITQNHLHLSPATATATVNLYVL